MEQYSPRDKQFNYSPIPANSVWAGPISGPSSTPSFRLLNILDIPGLSSAYLSTSLASGKILVGNLSNSATSVFLSLNPIAGSFGLSSLGALTMPDASATTRGLLNSADWIRFNAGGGGGGNFIPLTGTALGSPLTGTIDYEPITYNTTVLVNTTYDFYEGIGNNIDLGNSATVYAYRHYGSYLPPGIHPHPHPGILTYQIFDSVTDGINITSSTIQTDSINLFSTDGVNNSSLSISNGPILIYSNVGSANAGLSINSNVGYPQIINENASIILSYYDGISNTTSIEVDADAINFVVNDSTELTQLYINSSSAYINSTDSTFAGLTYSANYSVNYTSLSLITYGDLTNVTNGTQNFVTKFGFTGLTESIIYDDGTNVGIGTLSPSYKFQVNNKSNGTAEDLFAIFDSTGSSPYFKISSDTNSAANIDAYVYDTNFNIHVNGSVGQFKVDQGSGTNVFKTNASSGVGFQFDTYVAGTSLETGVLNNYIAALGTSGITTWTMAANRISVNSTGTDPGNIYGLYVAQGGSWANTSLNFYPGVFLNGNVGIGTSTPSATLSVTGSTGYNQFNMATSYTPTNSADTNGNTGDVAWDNSYVYIKTSVGWKRSTLSSF